MKKISIITPVYNESKVIKKFYHEVKRNLVVGYEYEIIFVDDNSIDSSLKIIKNISKSDPKIRYISFDKNYGQQTALFAGLKYCTGDAAILLDCDLQDPPWLITKMIKHWVDGCGVVLPIRLSRQDTFVKIYSAKAFYKIINLGTDLNLDFNTGEFYLIDRGVIDYIVKNVQAPLFLRGVVQKTNMLIIKIPYHRSGRKDGKSGFSLKKMFKLAKDAYIFAKNKNVEKVIYKVEESNIMIR